jgi:DivIVA domain-containing protein
MSKTMQEAIADPKLVTSDEVKNAQFSTILGHYNSDEVDDLLNRVALTLKTLESDFVDRVLADKTMKNGLIDRIREIR